MATLQRTTQWAVDRGPGSIRQPVADQTQADTIQQWYHQAVFLPSDHTAVALPSLADGPMRFLSVETRTNALLRLVVNGQTLEGSSFTLADTDVWSLTLASQGEVLHRGTITDITGNVYTDAEQEWTYAAAYGSLRPSGFAAAGLRFVLEVNGRTGLIVLPEGLTDTDEALASAIARLISESPIGGGQVSVEWDDSVGNDLGRLVFRNRVAGARSVRIDAHLNDHNSLVRLGLDQPRYFLGSPSLVGATFVASPGRANQATASITNNTSNTLTAAGLNPAPSENDFYQVRRAQDAQATVFVGR